MLKVTSFHFLYNNMNFQHILCNMFYKFCEILCEFVKKSDDQLTSGSLVPERKKQS